MCTLDVAKLVLVATLPVVCYVHTPCCQISIGSNDTSSVLCAHSILQISIGSNDTSSVLCAHSILPN